MDSFKTVVKFQEVVKAEGGFVVIPVEEFFHFGGDVCWGGGDESANFVGELFVCADGKPILARGGSAVFQNKMEFFDEIF